MDYLLKDVDESTWRLAKSRAAAEGRTMKAVIMLCLNLYGRDRIDLDGLIRVLRRKEKPE
jgi:hypothetical protein